MKPSKADRPFNRLTRIGDAMTTAATSHPETESGDRFIALIYDDKEIGGVSLHGYDPEDLGQAIIDMFTHLRAIAKANGLDLEFMPIKERPRG
jgi:hypothetical protein